MAHGGDTMGMNEHCKKQGGGEVEVGVVDFVVSRNPANHVLDRLQTQTTEVENTRSHRCKKVIIFQY